MYMYLEEMHRGQSVLPHSVSETHNIHDNLEVRGLVSLGPDRVRPATPESSGQMYMYLIIILRRAAPELRNRALANERAPYRIGSSVLPFRNQLDLGKVHVLSVYLYLGLVWSPPSAIHASTTRPFPTTV